MNIQSLSYSSIKWDKVTYRTEASTKTILYVIAIGNASNVYMYVCTHVYTYIHIRKCNVLSTPHNNSMR